MHSYSRPDVKRERNDSANMTVSQNDLLPCLQTHTQETELQ